MYLRFSGLPRDSHRERTQVSFLEEQRSEGREHKGERRLKKKGPWKTHGDFPWENNWWTDGEDWRDRKTIGALNLLWFTTFIDLAHTCMHTHTNTHTNTHKHTHTWVNCINAGSNGEKNVRIRWKIEGMGKWGERRRGWKERWRRGREGV